MYKDQLTHARNVKTCPPNFLVTDSRKTELNEMPDKEFKELGLWNLNECQENQEKWLNKLRKMIQDIKQMFTKEMKNLK